MSTRVVDQVDGWDERSFSGGFRELHELADSEFSGVVRADGAELYVTRGVAVGLRLGEIGDFESAGTVYEAPADALPLLAIMQEQNDEVKAKYYTEETGISKVDETLSDGGFTGFIELSENVLSGDYYIVYQAGRSMSVAYVGEAKRLLDGDEAFETADDEVGIYEVRPAEIEPVELPEPDETSADSAGASGTAGGATPPESNAEPSDSDATPAQADTAVEDEPTTETSTTPAGEEPSATATGGDSAATATEDDSSPMAATDDASATAAEDESSASAVTEADEPPTVETTAGGETATHDEHSEKRAPATEQPRSEKRRRHDQSPRSPQETRPEPRSRPAQATRRQERDSRTQTTASSQDLETKTIPSLDPARTDIPDQPGVGTDQTRTETGRSQDHEPRPSDPEPEPDRTEITDSSRSAHAQHTADRHETTEPQREAHAAENSDVTPADATQDQVGDATDQIESDRIDELETELEQKKTEIERLEDELESATSDREELAAERDTLETEKGELEAEVQELESEVQRLESELTQLEEELGAATDAERRITASEALAGTDIFVRYGSKGKPTLEKAHGSSIRKDEVDENLRLEKHTQFDASAVAVGGRSYHEFLESTLEYQFVRWVVRELLFEIRDTGHKRELADLYEVLPQIDRAELAGVIDVRYTEDGQETQRQESFDVVLRDRMGHPLLAANLNDTRQATTEEMMERLITAAERVGQSSEQFSGAFLVTESFFDPGALEVASSATQGGLLSRDKRKSFVNLSRKSGYHLCLVEARNENFHLAVPEL